MFRLVLNGIRTKEISVYRQVAAVLLKRLALSEQSVAKIIKEIPSTIVELDDEATCHALAKQLTEAGAWIEIIEVGQNAPSASPAQPKNQNFELEFELSHAESELDDPLEKRLSEHYTEEMLSQEDLLPQTNVPPQPVEQENHQKNSTPNETFAFNDDDNTALPTPEPENSEAEDFSGELLELDSSLEDLSKILNSALGKTPSAQVHESSPTDFPQQQTASGGSPLEAQLDSAPVSKQPATKRLSPPIAATLPEAQTTDFVSELSFDEPSGESETPPLPQANAKTEQTKAPVQSVAPSPSTPSKSESTPEPTPDIPLPKLEASPALVQARDAHQLEAIFHGRSVLLAKITKRQGIGAAIGCFLLVLLLGYFGMPSDNTPVVDHYGEIKRLLKDQKKVLLEKQDSLPEEKIIQVWRGQEKNNNIEMAAEITIEDDKPREVKFMIKEDSSPPLTAQDLLKGTKRRAWLHTLEIRLQEEDLQAKSTLEMAANGWKINIPARAYIEDSDGRNRVVTNFFAIMERKIPPPRSKDLKSVKEPSIEDAEDRPEEATISWTVQAGKFNAVGKNNNAERTGPSSFNLNYQGSFTVYLPITTAPVNAEKSTPIEPQ